MPEIDSGMCFVTLFDYDLTLLLSSRSILLLSCNISSINLYSISDSLK